MLLQSAIAAYYSYSEARIPPLHLTYSLKRRCKATTFQMGKLGPQLPCGIGTG